MFLGAAQAVTSAAAAAPTSELVGRQGDLADVLERMDAGRLVTIVGTGGVGKTSLAREAFAAWCARRRMPGHWIDLAPIRESGQVLGRVAKALGVELTEDAGSVDVLVAALAQSEALVAIDNCEHLRHEVADLVRPALEGAPRLRWLATSQVPLHVAGETLQRLDPLAVPKGRMPVARALEYGAIAMLSRRTAEADRRFTLNDDNVDAAIDLCEQLDGLPLAIEMAAARVATFGLEEVRQRLDQRMKLLTAGRRPGEHRHAALQDMYDWSHSLLSAQEQAVFRRLEPFLGGFRSDMAQQVASDIDDGGDIDAWQTLDALGALVDKSLVQRAPDDPGRFHLLESARDYARARLDEAGETEAVHGRHARAVAQWFAQVHADADRMTDAQWLQRYAPERHNARAALAWACRHRAAEELAQLVAALAMMDWLLCRQAEILQTDVPLEVLALAEPRRRARAFVEMSWAHFSDGNHALGVTLAQSAFDTFMTLGETALAYRALAQVARLHERSPSKAADAQAAWTRLQEFDDRQLPLRTRLFCAISAGLLYRSDLTIERTQELGRLAESAGFASIAAICGCNLTDKLVIARRYADVVTTADRLLHDVGHLPRATAFILHNKAHALIRMGRHEEARAAGYQAFQTMPAVARFLVDIFAFGALREGRLADCAVLHGCGRRIREELHEQLDVSEAEALVETDAGLATGMDAAQRAELLALGAGMSAREALMIKVFSRTPAAPPRDASPAAARDRASSVGSA